MTCVFSPFVWFCRIFEVKDKNEKKEALLCLYFNIEKPAIQADICGKYGSLCDFLKIVYKVVETAGKGCINCCIFLLILCIFTYNGLHFAQTKSADAPKACVKVDFRTSPHRKLYSLAEKARADLCMQSNFGCAGV